MQMRSESDAIEEGELELLGWAIVHSENGLLKARLTVVPHTPPYRPTDMQEKCFICSIDRDMIESAGISFRNHIKHQVCISIYTQLTR